MQAHEKLQLISFLTGQRDKNIIVLPKKICRLGGWSRLFKVACMSELHDTSSIDNVPLISKKSRFGYCQRHLLYGLKLAHKAGQEDSPATAFLRQ